MPREFKRQDRVADQMQKELALYIQRELRDPRLGMVTVSGVKVSKDLAFADAYVTVLAAKPEEAIEVLTAAAGLLRGMLAKNMKMRVTPRLRFHYDQTAERGAYMNELIHKAVASDQPDDKSSTESSD